VSLLGGGAADVKTNEELDALVLTPRKPATIAWLAAALRRELPALTLRQRGGQLWIPPFEGYRLLGHSGAVDLCWTPEARLVVENRQRATSGHAATFSALEQLRVEGEPAVKRLLGQAHLLPGLDPHQRLDVAAMTIPESVGLCVFDEQGTGKTVTTIAAFDLLFERDEIDVVLVIAPKSMVGEWPRDIERMTGDLYTVQVIAGTRGEKLGQLRRGADIMITNFETVLALEPNFEALLRSHQGRALLVVDESFLVKNRDAKRTRGVRRLRERCGRAFVLCGTPAPNAAKDLVEQFTLVDFGMTFGDQPFRGAVDPSAEEVRSAMEARGCFVRSLKSEVLKELPGKSFERVLLPMSAEQASLYNAARDDLVSSLRRTTDDEFRRNKLGFLARRAALLQICSNPAGVVSDYMELPAKLLALDDMLEELIARRHEKVVVWSFFTKSIDAICARYARYHPIRYDGTVADVGERQEAVRAFQEDADMRLFVGNPAAAGAGLTLHSARYAIYESFSNQPAHYLQSLDRIHRRGQGREVRYVVLLCQESVELSEFDMLRQKEAAAHDLLGDQVSPAPTRDSLLAELESVGSLFSPW
jgi:SNF2 family DNA or RNA helicase